MKIQFKHSEINREKKYPKQLGRPRIQKYRNQKAMYDEKSKIYKGN